MARWMEPDAEAVAAYAAWVAELPEASRALAERLEPWSLYRLRSSGHRVFVKSFCDDGTVMVCVSGAFNAVLFERDVFGVGTDDLEPCELPEPGEQLGAFLDEREAADGIDALRVSVRPDLWEIGEDGKARWKGKQP